MVVVSNISEKLCSFTGRLEEFKLISCVHISTTPQTSTSGSGKNSTHIEGFSILINLYRINNSAVIGLMFDVAMITCDFTHPFIYFC